MKVNLMIKLIQTQLTNSLPKSPLGMALQYLFFFLPLNFRVIFLSQ